MGFTARHPRTASTHDSEAQASFHPWGALENRERRMTTTQFSGTSPRIESPDDLLIYVRGGEKPRARWRVGIEHEKLGFLGDTFAPIPYDGPRGIRALLEGFIAQFG